MKFYLDESISHQIASIARRLGVDATSSYEQSNKGRPDEEQLTFAAERGYCIVTFDLEDFTGLAKRWADGGRVHCGILLLTPSLPPEERNFAAIAHAIAHALKQFSDAHPDVIHHLDWLRGASVS